MVGSGVGEGVGVGAASGTGVGPGSAGLCGATEPQAAASSPSDANRTARERTVGALLFISIGYVDANSPTSRGGRQLRRGLEHGRHPVHFGGVGSAPCSPSFRKASSSCSAKAFSPVRR